MDNEIILDSAEKTLHRIVTMIYAKHRGDIDKTAFEVRDLTGHGKGFSYAIVNRYLNLNQRTESQGGEDDK